MLKYVLNFGAVLGLLLTGLSLVSFVLKMESSGVFDALQYAVLIGGLFYGTKTYRNGAKGGYIEYGESLGFGTAMAAASAVVFAFFLYIYLTFVDAAILERTMEVAKNKIYSNPDMGDLEKEKSIEFLSMTIGPRMFAISAFLSFTFLGFLFSLIISFFLKNPEPFMDGLDDVQ
jgi:hypothetical protein